MGRDDHNSKRSKNKKSKLPLTPARDIATDDQDLEIAKELTDRYDFEKKPGFPPTGANRKND